MKQKIVFFTARDLSNVGGGERMLSLIANGLCDSFSITILTPYEAESFYPFDERITIENLGFKNRKLSAQDVKLDGTARLRSSKFTCCAFCSSELYLAI